jgi:hypothetical protein
MTDYTPQQRDIIRRMGEIAMQQDRVSEAGQTAMREAGNRIIDIGTALIAAMDRHAEMVRLQRQYGDLFREYLDTL